MKEPVSARELAHTRKLLYEALNRLDFLIGDTSPEAGGKDQVAEAIRRYLKRRGLPTP